MTSALCRKADELAAKYPEFADDVYLAIQPGWFGLVDELLDRIDKALKGEDRKFFKIHAIEEKYCLFRFHYDNGTQGEVDYYVALDVVDPIFHEIERRSGITCGRCGCKGRILKGAPMPTCEEHDDPRYKGRPAFYSYEV